MSIDLVHFTPLSALAGGVMIGAAASLLILGGGRILGAAGIFAACFDDRSGEPRIVPANENRVTGFKN